MQDHEPALAPAVRTAPMKFRDAATIIVLAALVTAIGAYVVDLILPVAMSIRYGFGIYMPWPGSAPVLGTHTLTAALVGGLVPGVATGCVLASRFAGARWVRGLAIAFGAACLGLAILTFGPGRYDDLGNATPVSIANLVVLGLGVVAAVYVAFRRRVAAPAGGRGRTVLVAAIVAEFVALSIPTFAETYEEYRPQALRPFTIEIAAAYPILEPGPGEMGAVVIDANGRAGDIVEHEGQRYTIHRTDRIVIPAREVERVRWIDTDERAAIVLRLDDDVMARLRERSLKRMSQHDALYVDGALVSIPLYTGVLTDRWALTDTDRASLRPIYERLVR